MWNPVTLDGSAIVQVKNIDFALYIAYVFVNS